MISIRKQLTRTIAVLTMVAVGIALAAFYVVVRAALLKNFEATLRAKAYAVSFLTDQIGGKVAFDVSPEIYHYFDGERPRTYFQIKDAAGKVAFGLPELPADEDLQGRHSGTMQQPFYFEASLPHGKKAGGISVMFTPRPEEGYEKDWDPNLQMQLLVLMERGEVDATLDALLLGGIACWVVFTGAILVLVPGVMKKELEALDELGEKLAALDEKNLAVRLSMRCATVELQPVVDRLNEMLSRLETAFDRERQFGIAVAHELRTPLAELRSMLDCAIQWPETREAEFDADALKTVQRMEVLLRRMLALARGELGQLPAECAAVPLQVQLRRVWQGFSSQADARQLRVEWDVEAQMLRADEALLRSVLENLLDNVIEHAPDGCIVTIGGRTEPDGRSYLLRLSNPAPGLGAADVASLFDAFWRKEISRSDNRHSGLGLSLARMFALAMGGDLSATLDGRGNICFALRLVVAASTTAEETPPAVSPDSPLC